jgi:hypothetical protein
MTVKPRRPVGGLPGPQQQAEALAIAKNRLSASLSPI